MLSDLAARPSQRDPELCAPNLRAVCLLLVLGVDSPRGTLLPWGYGPISPAKCDNFVNAYRNPRNQTMLSRPNQIIRSIPTAVKIAARKSLICFTVLPPS